jgi:hypothetical protein
MVKSGYQSEIPKKNAHCRQQSEVTKNPYTVNSKVVYSSFMQTNKKHYPPVPIASPRF